MGAVYLAKDLRDHDRLYAIKEMSLSLIPPQDQAQAIQNFRVEAKILWGLNHPNLPTLEYFFEENERYFLVMEYIDGDTLENYLERKGGPFPERRVLEWARQLCDVLAYLHSQRPPIIFRDMKPGNIMLSRRNGQIKLIDFGIARFFRPTNQQDTQILGTPGYAPPEQYGKAQTDERSDIYALGMTLFHLLTNKLSEHGFGLENVHRDYPRISPNVALALEKATSLKPDDRFQTVDEFRHALFDVGVFVFESGDIVATPDEMAHMCVNYPEEAAEYLFDGEIEAWLQDLGEVGLAETARRVVKLNRDPIKAIEQFVQAVATQNIQERSSQVVRSSASAASPGAASTVPVLQREGREARLAASQVATTARADNESRMPAAGSSRLAVAGSRAPISVQPHALDFGTVFPGISAAVIIQISGTQGDPVRGTIRSRDSWIQLGKTTFNSALTEISVRVNSLHLQRNQHYTGEIVIVPEQYSRAPIVVSVDADVQGYVQNKRHPGRTHGADLDDYDAEDLDSIGNAPVITVKPPVQHVAFNDTLDRDDTLDHLATPQIGKKPLTSQVTPPALDPARVEALRNLQSSALSPQRERTLRLIMAFACSFMTATLGYSWLSHNAATILNSPSPLFVLMLAIMIPGATLGALIVLYEHSWRRGEILNRALTGMTGALVCLALCEFIWQLSFDGHTPGWLQLLVMLLVVAFGATSTVCTRPHRWIISTLSRSLRAFGRPSWTLVFSIPLGGILGYFLSYGFASLLFTSFGILLSIGIIASLIWRVNALPHQRRS